MQSRASLSDSQRLEADRLFDMVDANGDGVLDRRDSYGML